jgi:hypothetical protein
MTINFLNEATISRIYTMSNEALVFGGRQQSSGFHISETLNQGLLQNSHYIYI